MPYKLREPDRAKRAKAVDAVVVDDFPVSGNVRAKQAARYLGIGVSTFWLYVGQSRIEQPMMYGPRVSVWPAAYIRELAISGIPEAVAAEV